jgi:hypothetical protein
MAGRGADIDQLRGSNPRVEFPSIRPATLLAPPASLSMLRGTVDALPAREWNKRRIR